MSNILAYLAGVVDSDGCVRVERYGSSRTRKTESYAVIVTIQQVERQAIELAQRARGSVASVYRGRRGGIATIQGRTVKTRDEWKILISERNDSAFIKPDGAWKKVRTNMAFGKFEVWDIQVDEDESFVAEGCAVHNCPLQLDIIERALVLWSNPSDTVLSPFMGIGSEGYMAVKAARRFVGIELKEAYWRQAVENLKGERPGRPTCSQHDYRSSPFH